MQGIVNFSILILLLFELKEKVVWVSRLSLCPLTSVSLFSLNFFLSPSVFETFQKQGNVTAG